MEIHRRIWHERRQIEGKGQNTAGGGEVQGLFSGVERGCGFRRQGRNIFYVLVEEKEMETFVFFQTAEQLEKIILGTLAENLDVILGAGIDEVNVGFTTENADGKNYKSIEYYLPILTQKLDVLCKAGKIGPICCRRLLIP